MELKNLGAQTGNAETSVTNRFQEMKERISDIEDTIKEMVKSEAKVYCEIPQKTCLCKTVYVLEGKINSHRQ